MNKLLILIPAYNEENNIRKVIQSFKESEVSQYADIVVIDDGSRDQTAVVAEAEGVLVISQIYNMGYGAALQTGYKYAVQKGYEYLIQLDADGQHDIANVSRIYEKLIAGEGTDIVIGSRYLPGSTSFKMSVLRLWAVKFFRVAIRLATHQVITDPTSGLQGLSRNAFTYYAGFSNFDIHYPDINMLVQMLLLGYRVAEIPALMYQRTEGQPMHSGVIKIVRYMVLMMLSTMNAMTRYHKGYRKKKRLGKKEL